MKTRLSVVAIALSTLVAGHALAADPSVAKTREQVRAELVEAQRTGNLIADSETGLRFNQLYPSLYPQATVAAVGKTRDEVKAELAEAQRNGDLIADSETGQRLNQLYPEQYAASRTSVPAAVVVAQGKTRAEVKAELAEAQRNGDLIADSETGLRFNQLYPNRYPQPVVAQGKSREDVRAELVNASSVRAN
jgi:predicted RNase H-like HicB family nuclease